MAVSEIDCFACRPAPPAAEESPWQWSTPRALCVAHKAGLRMEDGEPLRALLERAAPPGHPLEGSLLAWIYNPVVTDTGVRGWTDFAAGGMAVFEDRFAARDTFEYRAFEVPQAVDLLHALRAAAAWPTTLAELVAAVMPIATPPHLRGPRRGPIAGLEELLRAWRCGRELERRRSLSGVRWPRSWAELETWTSRLFDIEDGAPPERDGAFFAALRELSLRRFPAR